MATIAELYGHPLGSTESLVNLASAVCPFMQAVCNGGGNRDMADLTLAQDPGLRARFDLSFVMYYITTSVAAACRFFIL